ncbi:hypothetical protein GWK47_045945 [Chionoecetes opilio]|uniref:Uncharacterized protein n=1 Tax=Chionoecetes opilio TaxID=41210 RepID=A0A8J4Y556_CHIOP|nr:hypothetical protein GWK47_045945 [Chionoecetes opilio]
MANVGVVGQTATVTQSFHQQQVMRQRSERIDLKTPEGDLGDVEADFQSLVNEMAKDSGSSSVKSINSSNIKQETFSSSMVSKQSFSTSTSNSNSQFISTNLNGDLNTRMLTATPSSFQKEQSQSTSYTTAESGLVTAVPAQVIPDEGQCGGVESEVVVEKIMCVRDRIRKIEKQLSTEDIPSGPPEVLMSRGRSGSVKNLAEQFSQPNESIQVPPAINASAFKNSKSLSGSSPVLTGSGGGSSSSISNEGVVTTEFKSVKDIVSSFSQQEESTSVKNIEGEFKSVKETASIFQEPIQPMATPIRPPAAFLTDGESVSIGEEVEVQNPVAVLPPATMTRSIPAKAPAKAPATVIEPPHPQIMYIPEPEPVPTVFPRPEPPAAGPVAPVSPPTLAPEPASTYDFIASPKTAPTPTPLAPEPIVLVPESAHVVPPKEFKPTAPPPVAWRNTQEETAVPPPAAAPKPAAIEATPALSAPKEKVSTEEGFTATLIKSTSVTASESERVLEEALAEITKYSETLSHTSTDSRSTSAETVVQQPIQYSAQVKCEVRSGVNTPEVPVVHEQLQQQIQQQHQQEHQQKQQRQDQQQQKQLKQAQKFQQQLQTSESTSDKIEMRTTTTTTSSTFSSSGVSSAQILSSKATIAKTAAKPPKFGPTEGPPKYSLLRSNSTGSMGSTTTTSSGMKHAGSDKDLPKFNVKKVKAGLTANASKFTLASLDCLSFVALHARTPLSCTPPEFRIKHWKSLNIIAGV